MKRSVLFLVVAGLLVWSCTSQKEEVVLSENPFFSDWETPFQTPPFEKIKEEQYLPAMKKGMEQQNAKAVVIAEAPLAEMLTYATNLRAITQGRGIFAMEFVRYDIVPSHLLAPIVAEAKAESD